MNSSNDSERDSSILSFSHLFVGLDDENSKRDDNDDDNDYIVDDDYNISAFSVSSLRSLWQSESNLSFSILSSSDNTARMSNMRKAEDNSNYHPPSGFRDCASPPNCIDGGGDPREDGNAPRSIFGRGAKKKYNVRRMDLGSKYTPVRRHLHSQEGSSRDTGTFSLIDVEYSPPMNHSDDSSSGTFDQSLPPLSTAGDDIFFSSHARQNNEPSQFIPTQAQSGGGGSNDGKRWMRFMSGDSGDDGEGNTTMKRNTTTTQQSGNPITDENGPLLRPIVALAFPSAVQSILSNAYGFNSFIFVGHMRDRARSSIATIALSSVVGIQIVIFAFHNVIPSGANTHVSQYAGAGDRVMVGHCFRSAFYSSIAFGSIVGIVGRLFIVGISEMCNSDDLRVTKAIREYLSVIFLASPFFSVMLLVDGYYKSIGDASTPFKLELMSLVSNTLLNYVLVVHFDYGIGGSAIAASTARLLPALCGLYVILRGEHVSLSLLQDLSPGRRSANVESPAADRWRAVKLASQWAGAMMADWSEREAVATYGSVSCITHHRVKWRDDNEDKMEVENQERRHMRAASPCRTIGLNLRYVLATSLKMARIGVFDSIAACIYGACFTSLVRICGLFGDKEQAGLGAGLRGVEWLAFCLSEGFLVAAGEDGHIVPTFNHVIVPSTSLFRSLSSFINAPHRRPPQPRCVFSSKRHNLQRKPRPWGSASAQTRTIAPWTLRSCAARSQLLRRAC
jgi:hypothetical protein